MHSDKRLLTLARDLIRIDSQNPPGNEKRIAFFVKDVLAKSGLATRFVECGKDRLNTITVLKSPRAKAALLVTPHLDTVPAGRNWKFPPLSGLVYKKKMYGRGASDCKANLAVGMEVVRSIAEEKRALDYDIIFAATADEEAGSYHGLIPLLAKKMIRPDFALILDADDFNIIVAQKGLLHLRVDIAGKKAHGAYPERGINAIDRGAALMQRIKQIKFTHKKHPLLRPPTVNVGTIRGGDKVNMVADWCQIEFDIRYLPGMRTDDILAAIKKNMYAVAAPRNCRLEIIAQQNPCQIDTRHMLVRALKEASRATIGRYRLRGSEGATVMTLLDDYGIPALATGFGSKGCAHMSNEYVAVNNLTRGYHLLKRFLLIFNEAITYATDREHKSYGRINPHTNF